MMVVLVALVVCLVFAAFAIGGNLARIADALEAQNAHYKIGDEPSDKAAS